jgi:hypothetical protein
MPASRGQGSASPVTGPTPYSRAARTFAPGQVPGRAQQLVPQLVKPALQASITSSAVATCSWGQVRGCGRPQRGHARPGAQRPLAQGRGAVVEQHRVDALHPGGALGPQVMIGLQHRPACQDCDREGSSTPAAAPRPAASAGAGGRLLVACDRGELKAAHGDSRRRAGGRRGLVLLGHGATASKDASLVTALALRLVRPRPSP